MMAVRLAEIGIISDLRNPELESESSGRLSTFTSSSIINNPRQFFMIFNIVL